MARRTLTHLALVGALAFTAAPALAAQSRSAPPTPPGATCDPREAAKGEPELSPVFQGSWLVGSWSVTAWVNGRGVPDTVIRGRMHLRPRVPRATDSAFVALTPVIGYTNLEIEYVPGIEPFRTPVESRSDRYPGVELRMDSEGSRLVLGNPTAIAGEVVSLGVTRSATFHLFKAYSHDFQGQWSLAGDAPDRPWGGFCAVRIPDL